MSKEFPYILVVDDNAGVRRLLLEVFKDEGYFVEMASSGSEALQKISDKTPLLILLDVKMPGMSGMDVLYELKIHAPDVSVVMITAYSELDMVLKAKKCGLIQHYISKPFKLEELRGLVRNILLKKIKQKSCLLNLV